MEVDSSVRCIWVCSSVRETVAHSDAQRAQGPRAQGWLLETWGEREKKRVCVSDAPATHWGDWASETGSWRALQCRCLCVSAPVCAGGGAGDWYQPWSCVPSCQELESLGSRGSYCTDRASEPRCWRDLPCKRMFIAIIASSSLSGKGGKRMRSHVLGFFRCWLFLFILVCVAEHVWI